MGMAKKNWIRDAIKRPGSLRKALHIKNGRKIPDSRLEEAEHSKSPIIRKRAKLAETMRDFPRDRSEG